MTLRTDRGHYPQLPTEHAGRVPATVRELIEKQLRCLVLDAPFPCLGARAAFRTGSYLFNVHPDMNDQQATDNVLADLRYFAKVRHEMGNLYTYVASFVEPRMIPSEMAWEQMVWKFLQGLHDLDDTQWDARFSRDPADADFALSLGGLGQLVVTLYPGANRYTRRFAWPTLIFNPLEQDRANFPSDEEFLRFQNMIRDRDARLQGNVNPSLPPTLDDPQAPGFSGAPIDAAWECPLQIRPGHFEEEDHGGDDDGRHTVR
jgi:FPC/CPF motif-containing protein YcgG